MQSLIFNNTNTLPFHEVIILLSKWGRGLFCRASNNIFFAIPNSFSTFSTDIPYFSAVFSLLRNSINIFWPNNSPRGS